MGEEGRRHISVLQRHLYSKVAQQELPTRLQGVRNHTTITPDLEGSRHAAHHEEERVTELVEDLDVVCSHRVDPVAPGQ